jgi:hypothetical protein
MSMRRTTIILVCSSLALEAGVLCACAGRAAPAGSGIEVFWGANAVFLMMAGVLGLVFGSFREIDDPGSPRTRT